MSENETPDKLTWKDVKQATQQVVNEIPFIKGEDVRTARVQRALFLLTGQTVSKSKIRKCQQSWIQNHIWAGLHHLYPDVYRPPETRKRQVVLDTETTGLDPNEGHRLVEVAGVELVDGVRTGKTVQYFINPQRKIPREATDIHGITDAQVKDKPPFGEIARELLDFLKGAELVIHYAPFDVGFLDAELNRAGFGKIGKHCTVLDTRTMARRTWPGQSNSLDAILDRVGVDRSHRTLHGALLDAELLTEAYLIMATMTP